MVTENINLNKVCRSCLSEDGIMTCFFDNNNQYDDIVRIFETFTSIQLNEDDGLPSRICDTCIIRLNDSFHFRQMCLQSDSTVRTFLNEAERLSDKSDDKVEYKHSAEFDSEDISYDYEEKIDTIGLCSDQQIENKEDSTDLEYHSGNIKTDEVDIPSETITVEVKADKTCSICNKQFMSMGHYLNHIRKHERNEINLGTKKFKCQDCNKEYTSAHNLQIHMYSHSGYKPFSCEYCGRGFTKLISLNSHISTHTGVRLFLCSQCGKGFSTSTGLKRHRAAHTGERPFPCSLCPRRFTASGDLTVHMRCHTGEKPYLCPTCGKAFSRISHLNAHLRTHTGEKPYKCTQCGRAFAQSGDLKSHERTHTGEKPYECSLCKKRFIQSSGLASHMRTHSGEKLYICSVCPKAFAQHSSLARHMRCHKE